MQIENIESKMSNDDGGLCKCKSLSIDIMYEKKRNTKHLFYSFIGDSTIEILSEMQNDWRIIKMGVATRT